MLIGAIEGATRIVGKPQDYLGRSLRDDVLHCTVGGPGMPAMVSARQPTPDVLARLNAGACVYLRVFGTVHPPVALDVGDQPG